MLAGKNLQKTDRSKLTEQVLEGPMLCKKRVLVVNTGVVEVDPRRPRPGKVVEEGSGVETSEKSSKSGSPGPRMQLKANKPAKHTHEKTVAGPGTTTIGPALRI